MIGWRPAAFGLLLALLCWLGWVSDAAAKRIALVVGNAAYQNLSPLRNTSNDAAAMAASLRQVGFEVTTLVDADLRSMKRAFLEFGRAMRGEVEATFIFYAGHGVQVGGENFLMPVDANVRSEDEVALEGINANDFLQVLNGSRGSVNIVVLDACRNNPFQPVSARRRPGWRRYWHRGEPSSATPPHPAPWPPMGLAATATTRLRWLKRSACRGWKSPRSSARCASASLK